MAIPEKREDLVAMGYVYDNGAKCRGCGEAIEWWITPRGKKMPMSVLEPKNEQLGPFAPAETFIRVPHFGVCTAVAQFRKP